MAGFFLPIAVTGCGSSADRQAGSSSASSMPASGPFQLYSNSMAPAWLGPRFPALCQRCGQGWEIAAETWDSNRPVPCPACSSEQVDLGKLIPGQTAYLAEQPTRPKDPSPPKDPSMRQQADGPPWQRLDCIVFQSSDRSAEFPAWTCKRIWGLPGEKISLSQGELWVNGQMFRKSIEQLRQVMVPVSRSPADSKSHWYLVPSSDHASLDRRSGLELRAGESLIWMFSNPAINNPASNNPASNTPHISTPEINLPDINLPIGLSAIQPALPCPVLDDYWVNHSTPRNLVPVSDLLLSVQFNPMDMERSEPQSVTTVVVSCRYHGHSAEVVCRFGNPSTSVEAESVLDLLDAPREPSRAEPGDRGGSVEAIGLVQVLNPQTLSIGGWDGRLWVQWDQQPARLLGESERKGGLWEAANFTTFSITAKDGVTDILSLTVHRDLYLREDEREPVERPGKESHLQVDEYYVIGDNLPLSRDSRNDLGPIHASTIIGKLSPPK